MDNNRRYTLMAFPQDYDGINKLTLNIVLIPCNRNPLDPLVTSLDPVPATSFAKLVPQFRARIIPGLDDFPISTDPLYADLEGISLAGDRSDIFTALAGQFKITKDHHTDKAEKVKPSSEVGSSVSKYLPHSYRNAFNFTSPRHPNARIDDSYHCALRDQKKPEVNAPKDDVSWGKVFAHVLRQPMLAKACGMIFNKVSLTIKPDWFKDGGYLFIEMTDPESAALQAKALADILNEGPFIKQYAARIPKLPPPSIPPDKIKPIPLFAPILFPVLYPPNVAPPKGEWDKIFAEVSEYADGFANIVHASQPVSGNLLAEQQDGFHPVKDAGIRLAWDDEQILIWYIRQLVETPDAPGSGNRVDAPLGVFGYRIDVKEDGGEWVSLNDVTANKTLRVGEREIVFAGNHLELPYQVFPSQIDGNNNGYWLPVYFTNWIGKSLVLKDLDAVNINRQSEEQEKGVMNKPYTVKSDRAYDETAVNPKLLYGNTYRFRVRLTDISGGGPEVSAEPVLDAPAPQAEVDFRRFIAPGLLLIKKNPQLLNNEIEYFNEIIPGEKFDENPVLEIRRPLISYPAVCFTGKYDDPVALLTEKSKKMGELANLDELDQLNTWNELRKKSDKSWTNLSLLMQDKLKDQINDKKAYLPPVIDQGTRDEIEEMRKNMRVVGIADPDVTKVEVLVEVETLRMDNLLSISGQENYIPLYRTFRNLAVPFDETTTIPVEFRDIPALDLGNLNDPFNVSGVENSDLTTDNIDSMEQIILPTARKVRVTLRAYCDGDDTYFGFINNGNRDLDSRYGKTTSFLFYKESTDETALLLPKESVPEVQAIYLQPEPPFVSDGLLQTILLERTMKTSQPGLIQQLAGRLGVESKGLTLVGKKGERIIFGCSNRIRHSLSPDNSSITFASKAELVNHWLGCLVYKINRDWSWDALEDICFLVKRQKGFRNDERMEPEIILGDIELKHTAPFEAIQPNLYGEIDRNSTTLIFIDAIEPKTTHTRTNENGEDELRFPDEMIVRYKLIPQFKTGPETTQDNLKIDELSLPTTINPVQVPKLVSAGIALSPYVPNEQYSATEPRQRYLWLEFDQPVRDPNDTIFCRVLASAPDQLISNNHPEQFRAPEEPNLPIDPEYIRAIVPGQSDDMAGLSAMQPMEKATGSDVHYLLPIPAGLHSESPDLFGFFTYEFRIGHGHWSDRPNNLWSTAQGRFGRPLRVTGIQHPAPILICTANRNQDMVYVNAPFAKAVYHGKNVTADPPRTQLWGLLYAQVRRADGAEYKNILIDERQLNWNEKLFPDPKQEKLYLEELKSFFEPVAKPQKINGKDVPLSKQELLKRSRRAIFKDQPRTGLAAWYKEELAELLNMFGLPLDSSLSVLVVEVFGNITNLREHITNLDDQEIKQKVHDLMKVIDHEVNEDKLKTNLSKMAGMQQQILNTNLNPEAGEQMMMMMQTQVVQPLGSSLGHFRILRTSPLTPVPDVCCSDCKLYTTAK
jgi:hypothetical protein